MSPLTTLDKKLIRLASYFSILNAFIIISLKIFAWQKTFSTTVLASLIDSCLDAGASILNMVAIRIALQPPDNDHRFGHEKFQDLAVFVQSCLFGLSSIFIFAKGIEKAIYPSSIESGEIAIITMQIAIILTVALVAFQYYVTIRTKYSIIEADRLHYVTDLLTNAAVILSIYLSVKQGYIYSDAIFTILIAIYMMYGSYQLFTQAFKNLTDKEFEPEDKEKILAVIAGFPKIQGIHDLKTRNAGNKPFIQFHIEIDGNMKLLEAHKISEDLALALQEIFPGAEITIHQDPAGLEEKISFKE